MRFSGQFMLFVWLNRQAAREKREEWDDHRKHRAGFIFSCVSITCIKLQGSILSSPFSPQVWRKRVSTPKMGNYPPQYLNSGDYTSRQHPAMLMNIKGCTSTTLITNRQQVCRKWHSKCFFDNFCSLHFQLPCF